MRKLIIVLLTCVISLNIFTGCNYYGDDHNTNVSYKETNQYYSMKAHFNKSKMREVEEYMNNKIGKRSNMSFTNSQIDGKISLDDHTTFYIKKYPGRLEIKLDKNQNSDDSYQQIKSMCQGIKKVVIR